MPRPQMPEQPDHATALRVIALVVLLFVASIITGLYKWLG